MECGFVEYETGKFPVVAGNAAENCCIVRALLVDLIPGLSGAAALGRLKESGVLSVGKLVGGDVTMTAAFWIETPRSLACKVAETRSLVIFRVLAFRVGRNSSTSSCTASDKCNLVSAFSLPPEAFKSTDCAASKVSPNGEDRETETGSKGLVCDLPFW